MTPTLKRGKAMEDKQIKAYYRREERYEGLQIVFFKDTDDREKVQKVVDETIKESGTTPKVFENCYKDDPNKCAFYIEFEDDYDKDAGDVFESILCKLGIEKCS